VGSLEEGNIQPMLSGANACPTDYYLRGWDTGLGQPICALDWVEAQGYLTAVAFSDLAVQVATPPAIWGERMPMC
jgi:hypothetical protein